MNWNAPRKRPRGGEITGKPACRNWPAAEPLPDAGGAVLTVLGANGGQFGGRGEGRSHSTNLLKRIEKLEAAFVEDPGMALLNLISRCDEPAAKAELERRIAAGAGPTGLLNVAEVLLFAQAQVAELDAAEIAALDATR